MKYILKKDLPFAKAGTELEIIRNEGRKRWIIPYDKQWATLDWQKVGPKRFGCYKFELTDTIALRNDGWIEEVKPREWIIEVTKEQQYIRPADAKGRLYSSGSEIIKVREVINERNA